MKRIGVISYKGGTGKTTTVVNLGHSLALRGKKVLLIDSDPQGAIGYYLGLKPKHTLAELLLGDVDVKGAIINSRTNLDVICANEHLFPAELTLAKMNANREQVLVNRLKSLTEYDYVLIDCAPAINLINQNVLVWADSLWMPVSMEYLALIGVKQLLKNIKIINRIFNKEVGITVVIPTFFDSRNQKSKDVLESLKRVFAGRVSTPIRLTLSLSEAPGYRKTIFEYNPKSIGAEDYTRLANEVLKYEYAKRI